VTNLEELRNWVNQVCTLAQPDSVNWCTESVEENQQLINLKLDTGGLIKLNPETHPGCYLHRSDPDDVARVKHLAFVCTSQDAQPEVQINQDLQSYGDRAPVGLLDECKRVASALDTDEHRTEHDH